MSETSPADLVALFRGLPRRLLTVTSAGQELVGTDLAAAARLLGVAVDADPGVTSQTIASAIEARHPDQWVESELAELRRIGLAAGASIRDHQE